MQRWMRPSLLAAAVVLVLSACADASSEADNRSGESATTTAPSTDAPATTQPSSTQAAGNGSDSAPSTTPPPQVEGPAAPDFTFALADGTSFTLSAEQKPVYLVFWAEW